MFGISRQAYYKRIKQQEQQEIINQKIIKLVMQIRKKMPKTGTKKLYEHLKPKLEELHIKMGRDALNTLLRNRGFLVKKNKCFHITTDSKHFFYTSPNLLKNTKITHSEQAFATDITYIRTDQGHAYLALVTDLYSKQIMGYALEDNMKVEMVKKALKMACKNLMFSTKEIIHHSDRGIQYCCPDYTEFAKKEGFKMSTTQKYDPYENAVTERVNGILKHEFGLKNTFANLNIAQKATKQAIEIYNNQRLHWSLNFKTPKQAHKEYDKQKYKSYAKKVA